MQFNAIVDRAEAFKAFQKMQLAFFERAELCPDQPLGHQGRSSKEAVFWLRTDHIWAALTLSALGGGRYLSQIFASS